MHPKWFLLAAVALAAAGCGGGPREEVIPINPSGDPLVTGWPSA